MTKTPQDSSKSSKECVSCGASYAPYLINESMCLDCSIEINDHIISLNTDITGYCKKKKLLRRRYQLRELRPIKQYTGADRINQICKGCGETFITPASFKNRLLKCPPCQALANKLVKEKV